MKVKFSIKGYPIFSKKRGQIKEIEKIDEQYKCTFSNNETQYYDINGKNGFDDKLYCEIPIEISFVPLLLRILISVYFLLCILYILVDQPGLLKISFMFLCYYLGRTLGDHLVDNISDRRKYRNLNHYKRINLVDKK